MKSTNKGMGLGVSRLFGRSSKVACSALLVVACGAEDGAVPSASESTEALTGGAAEAAAVSARSNEVEGYLQRTYFSRFQVLATTDGPMGEVVDWVDPHELDPDYDKRTPPPLSALGSVESPAQRTTSAEGPARVEPGYDLRAAWAEAAKKAPRGTVPIVRPNFDHYVSGESGKRSVVEFVDSLNKPQPLDHAQPQPAGQLRLYTSKAQTLTNIGTQGWMQYVNPAQVPSTNAFSLTQLASLCWGAGPGSTTLEAIEVGFQKFPGKYGDSNLHFFTFFRTNGGNTGNYIGGYNLDVAGFVQAAGAFPPGATIPSPPAGQAHQRMIRTTLWNGAWWVLDYVSATSFTWLGYYPIGTGAGQVNFDLINTSACATHWYGEVYDSTPTSWHDGDLGNGVLGTSAGSLAFFDMLIQQTNQNVWFNGTGTATDSACYAMTALSNNGSSNWFNFGGPGGDGAGCN